METQRKTKRGTAHFMTPEALASHDIEVVSQKTDVWGAGLVIYFMAYLKHPFQHPDNHEMEKKIIAGMF